jgi:type IV pilus assembly protein PilB
MGYAMLNHSRFQNNTSSSNLANHLINDGLLTQDIAIQAQTEAHKKNIPFISYLVRNHILSSSTILQSCAKEFQLPIYDLKNYEKKWLNILNPELIQSYHALPLHKENNILHIGVSDPSHRQTFEMISFHTGLKLSTWLIDENQLSRFINTEIIKQIHHNNLELSLLNELPLEDNNFSIQDNTVAYDEPLIRFVDHIIQHALQQSSSDIHIEPYETTCRIRYRKNGLLYEVAEVPVKMAARLVTRLKVMARLDIAERRLPQDGRFQQGEIDVRINTCPTLFGEKIVLRLLDGNKSALNIQDLGFSEQQQTLFIEKISQSQGLILVTGPTGSGKTITLYSAINNLNTIHKNISTVEDPIEIKLKGINQVNINPKINFHFATALRTFLRQDPDIIMVGEIRDPETAEIVVQAAQTGHLVLSTLHTNSAAEAITRLITMGIPSYNLTSSISLIIAQRLIRKLCPICKQPEELTLTARQKLGLSPNAIIYCAKGCQECLQGYESRFGIFELLSMDKTISKLILNQTDPENIITLAKQNGFISLREMALQKVNEGVTSLTEINRVT